MSLTGTGIRIGDVTQFEASIRYPRGLASNGTTLLLFDANKGHTLNPTTGAATRIGTLTNFDVSESQLRSACWNGTNFAFYGNSRRRLYTYDSSDGSVTDLTGELSIRGSNTNPDVWGLAFLDGMYWALERQTDALYNIVGNELVQVGTANNYGLTGSPNIQAFTSYRGELIGASNGLDRLVRFNKTTGVATAIADSTLPDGSPEALVEHDGKLLMAGSAADALFRLHDVRWNETIANLEIDEGGSQTWSLADRSQDAESFIVQPGETLASWLSVSGINLVAANAPAVDADTIVTVPLRAQRVINSGQANEATIFDDKTLRINVADVPPPPPILTTPSVPRSLRTTNIEPTAADFALDAPTNNGGAAIEYYEGRYAEGTTIPANTPWIAFTSDDSTTFTLSQLKKGTEYAVEVRAVNSEGGGASTGVLMFTTDATEPDTPTLTTDTVGARNVEISWQNGENGGSEVTGHQYRIQEGNTAGGTWENTDSTDTTYVIRNLKPSTQHTAQVRTLNDEGESQPSNAVTFTTQAPKPPVWETGTAMKRTIHAGESATIDVGTLVEDAEKIEEIFGVQYQWMEWNEATKTLTLTDAPIVREDTNIQIRFIAENDEGETPGDFVVTLKGSVLASLYNTLFFEEPLNYEPGRVQRHNSSTIVTELTDNDKATFSRHTDFDIDMADADGNPTAFDCVGIIAKGQNIQYSITLTGGTGTGFSNRQMPETIKNIGGGTVKTVVNGFTYDLYPLPRRVTATSVRLQISGTNLKIYAVMLLKLGYELDANSEFIEMAFDRVDRTGQLPETPDGTIERDRVLGAEPFKFEAQYTIIMDGSDVDEWMDWTEANVNCAFAREFSRHPQDMFLAFFPALEMPNGYLGLVKSVGETVEFGIAEQ